MRNTESPSRPPHAPLLHHGTAWNSKDITPALPRFSSKRGSITHWYNSPWERVQYRLIPTGQGPVGCCFSSGQALTGPVSTGSGQGGPPPGQHGALPPTGPHRRAGIYTAGSCVLRKKLIFSYSTCFNQIGFSFS